MNDWNSYKNKRGIEFFITAKQKETPPGANYWLWLVRARSGAEADAPGVGFFIFVTKDKHPDEIMAERIARGPALEHAKGILEVSEADKRPILMWHYNESEGWAVL